MKKPPDPAPPPLLSTALSRSSSSPLTAFPDFRSNLLNYSAFSLHNLATSLDLLLIARIWKSYEFCRWVLRIYGESCLFDCKTGGFTHITLPAVVWSSLWGRVVQSFGWMLLWPQHSSTVVSDLPSKSDGCSSFFFMAMHWIWLQRLLGELVLGSSHRVHVQFSCERDRRRNSVQIFINYRTGVFVPLLLFFFINACFNSQFLGNLCCEFGCLFIPTGWDGLYAQFPLFGLPCIHTMSDFSPRSPLSISSKSDSSSDYMHDSRFIVFLLGWFRILWILFWAVNSCILQSMLGICFIVIIPYFWMNVCAFTVLAWWFNTGGDLSLVWSAPKEGCMPDYVAHRSVAPWKGEQPWMKPPRCCLLGPNWSTVLSVVIETLFHALKAFFQVNLFCFTDPGLLITVLSCSFKLFWLSCICWMYPVSTLPCSGSLFTVLTRVRYDLWWLVGFDPANFCGVLLVPRDQMKCYEYLHYKLHLLNDYLSPNLITYSNWLSLWECPFLMTYLHLESISIQVPGCSGRISAAPAQSEKSDSITPRCGYFWLTGSMMRVDCSETSEAESLLTLCSFKFKILFNKPDITWTLKCIHLYTIRNMMVFCYGCLCYMYSHL